jgi:hypothetical protein
MKDFRGASLSEKSKTKGGLSLRTVPVENVQRVHLDGHRGRAGQSGRCDGSRLPNRLACREGEEGPVTVGRVGTGAVVVPRSCRFLIRLYRIMGHVAPGRPR